jgi:hypothetical protein
MTTSPLNCDGALSEEEQAFLAEAEENVIGDRVRRLTAVLGLPEEAMPAVEELLLEPYDGDDLEDLSLRFDALRRVIKMVRG